MAARYLGRLGQPTDYSELSPTGKLAAHWVLKRRLNCRHRTSQHWLHAEHNVLQQLRAGRRELAWQALLSGRGRRARRRAEKYEDSLPDAAGWIRLAEAHAKPHSAGWGAMMAKPAAAEVRKLLRCARIGAGCGVGTASHQKCLWR